MAVSSIIRYTYKTGVLKILYPILYRAESLRRLSPKKAVFIEVRGHSMSNNFTLLWGELAARGYDCRLHCLGLSSVGFFEYDRRCRRMIHDIADAPVVFINDGSNVLSALPLRKETQVIQTWHACGAFKRFGLGTAELGFGGSRREQKLFPTYKNCNAVTVSSPEIIWAYAESMGIPEERILPIGVSRTDIFFDGNIIRESAQKVREKMGVPLHKKILLYAPTFRGETARDARAPECFDPIKAVSLLGDEYFILIKHHPFVSELPKLPEGAVGYAPNDMTIDEALMAADVCVTDYSSLVFEYSLLRRPVFFLAPDIGEYIDERGFYYPFADFAPGPVVSTTEELAGAVLAGDFDFDELDVFRGKFMSSCDGNSTERILGLLNV